MAEGTRAERWTIDVCGSCRANVYAVEGSSWRCICGASLGKAEQVEVVPASPEGLPPEDKLYATDLINQELRARAEKAEAQAHQAIEALDRIAKAHADAAHLQEVARACLAEIEGEQ